MLFAGCWTRNGRKHSDWIVLDLCCTKGAVKEMPHALIGPISSTRRSAHGFFGARSWGHIALAVHESSGVRNE